MKTKVLFLFAAFVGMMIFGCKKDKEVVVHNVSGYLYSDGQPVVNADITIDGLVQYTATSDNSGYFKIAGVSVGAHRLTALKSFNDGSFSCKSYDLDVNTDLELQYLMLPNPPQLLSITYDSVLNQVRLTWDHSLSSDFTEYKVYSHTTSGLDQNTGTLEHVATDVMDTTVTLAIPNATKMYYRVYVMDNLGQMGGSNILNITSANHNFFIAGDFEDTALFFSTWTAQGHVYIIDTVSHNGSKSLYLWSNVDTATYYFTIYQLGHPQFLLTKNEEYKLSFWYRARGPANMMAPWEFWYIQNSQQYMDINFGTIWSGTPIVGPIEYIHDTGWIYYSVTFIPNSETAVEFTFRGSVNELFIDDLQLKKN